MEIKINQHEFYKGIQTVKKAVSAETTLPILSGILLTAKKNKLKLAGTDLELGIQYFIPGEVSEKGSIVLPAEYLTDMIKELPNEEIVLSTGTENNTCQIKCGNSKFNIYGSSAEEFPLLPEIESNKKFTLQQRKLKQLIKQIQFAVAKDTNKSFLTGGLLAIEKELLKLIATDTYRLAYREEEEKLTFAQQIIIPSKTLTELTKILENSTKKVDIILTNNQILFKLSNIFIISQLIEGQFPNYQQVIPKQTNTKVKVNKNLLFKSIKRAALLNQSHYRQITTNFTEEKLIITSQVPEIGQAYEEIPIELTGTELEINFNASYLLDCLQVIDSKEVIIELSNSLSPAVIKTNSEDEYIYVIMPARNT